MKSEQLELIPRSIPQGRDELYPQEFERVKQILRRRHPKASEKQIEHWARVALSRWRDK